MLSGLEGLDNHTQNLNPGTAQTPWVIGRSEFLFQRPEIVMADEDATAVSVEGPGHTETAEQAPLQAKVAFGKFRGEELRSENFTSGIVLHT